MSSKTSKKRVEDLAKTEGESAAIEKRRYVPPEERKQRRQVVSRLLASCRSIDDICDIMSRPLDDPEEPGFGMSESEVRKLINETYAKWSVEDQSREKYQKGAARRRIYEHIERAAAEGKQWSAVAQLEKTVAMIEGTLEQEVTVQGSDARLNEALIEVLKISDPAEIRRIVDEERAKSLGQDTTKSLPAPLEDDTTSIRVKRTHKSPKHVGKNKK